MQIEKIQKQHHLHKSIAEYDDLIVKFIEDSEEILDVEVMLKKTQSP